ncbi:SMI1/KNR4 family protein [Vibrio splendidus]|uniref:SMI1/KNR4 family protein n=1 Tax=Vibrio splendidus TaxID=29497 RepID=UPI000C817DC8|nr:SMI1/KNR4 family protein [Vibrio splendidus]MCC5518645.1 SMI1/KNR4 family protein [Vibrio splendidus]
MEEFELKIPTDIEIKEAQEKLGFIFPSEYVAFIKSGYDLGDAPLEALEIVNPPSYADIYEALESARKSYGLPVELMPICEDNSDYYCINQKGEVVFWSNNGTTDEKWKNVTIWRNQMV